MISFVTWRQVSFAAVCAVLVGCGPGEYVAEAAPTAEGVQTGIDSERAFFENMAALCNNTYGGRTILAPVQDDTFEPARLYFIMESCEPDEIRMPFIVDGDASRTWVLTMENERLLFTHEHRRDDGTEYEGSGFGGWAAEGGTEWFQSFPNYRQPDDTPHDERGIWRLRIDHDNNQFVYYLDRGDDPRYRLVFHLGEPSPPLPALD